MELHAYISPFKPHHTHSARSTHKHQTVTRCFQCLASDHLVDICRDHVRCSQCWRSGHRSFSGAMAHTTSTHTASGSFTEANDNDFHPVWFSSHYYFIDNHSTPVLPRQLGVATTTTPPPTAATTTKYCISASDFVSVSVMVMVTRGTHLPPGMVVMLPGRDLIMVSLTKLAFHAHGIGPDDPSPFSSDDGGDSESYDVHDAAIREATLREFVVRPLGGGPPPSQHDSV
ncbi:hypothetical protein ZWY2020_020721 [Hordeum vulgare]|nr:hypothetical protein ZWY2020_020721 [Hordeum vulgare]